MKPSLFVIIIICAIGSNKAYPQTGAVPASPVQVATALNHLTVLEFHEPVRMAAVGSSDFQIERQDDKIFIKPIKSGASTDLFVWTASRRFAYELETTGEVKNMNASIDNPLPPPSSASLTAGVSPHIEGLADIVLTRALLRAIDITQANPKAVKGHVRLQIKQVFRTRTSIYVHYSIENGSRSMYHIRTPEAFELQTGRSTLCLPNFAHKQLDPRLLENLADIHVASLPVPHAEVASEDLAPGKSTEGVVAIRQNLSSPAVVQLVLDGQVKATFVL